MPTDGAQRLVIGLVHGLHGLRGAIRVEVLTDDASRFAPGSVVFVEGSETPLTVSWSRTDGPGVQLRFRELPTRDHVQPLRGCYLEAPATGAELPVGTYYWHQIEGTPVFTRSGELLGNVVDIFRTGGSEVYVVRGGRHGEVLIPAVGSVIRELAPEAGRIVVDEEVLGLEDEVRAPRPRGRRTTRALRAAEASAPVGSAETSETDPGAQQGQEATTAR